MLGITSRMKWTILVGAIVAVFIDIALFYKTPQINCDAKGYKSHCYTLWLPFRFRTFRRAPLAQNEIACSVKYNYFRILRVSIFRNQTRIGKPYITLNYSLQSCTNMKGIPCPQRTRLASKYLCKRDVILPSIASLAQFRYSSMWSVRT